MAPTVASLSKEFEDFKVSIERKLATVHNTLESVKSAVTGCHPESVNKLQSEIDDIKKAMDFMSSKFEAAKSENSGLKSDNKHLNENNQMLLQKIRHLEQYSRLNNLEIRGVPTTQGENCRNIVELLGKKVGCPIKPEDIDTVHRVPTRDINNKNIIVRFCSRDMRTEFLKKARKFRPKTDLLGFSAAQEKPIYVNEHLTSDNKRLFSKALALKKQMKWAFLWTDNCVIKARQTLDSVVHRLVSEVNLHVFNA